MTTGISKWMEASMVVAGLVMAGKITPDAVNLSDLMDPYSKLVKVYQDGGGEDEALKAVDFAPLRDVQLAVEAVDDTLQAETWLRRLTRNARNEQAAAELDKFIKQLREDKDIHPDKLYDVMQMVTDQTGLMVSMDKIKPIALKDLWIPTGYPPLDKHTRGLPKAGLTLIAGSPGIGKTTLGLRIVMSFAYLEYTKWLHDGLTDGKKVAKKKRTYVPKKAAVFSLEMLLEQVAGRIQNLDPEYPKEALALILGADKAYTAGEVISEAVRNVDTQNVGLILIDFADLMVEGEQSEATMGMIYRQLSMFAKRSHIPVVLICQLNRSVHVGSVSGSAKGAENENGNGAIPRIYQIRYSGMAEMMAALIILVYNPSTTLSSKANNTILPYMRDRGYIILGKSRFGLVMGHPGAIQTEWHPETGWGDTFYRYIDLQV